MDMQNVAKLEIPEGEVRTIHDKNGDLFWGKVSYSVEYKGDTSQNGTPTPSAPVAVQTVTGENIVKVSDGQNEQSYEVNLGKNLFDKNNANVLNAYFALPSDTTITSNAQNRTLYIPCAPNTTYTFQAMASNWIRQVGYTATTPAAGVSVSGITNLDRNVTSITITTGSTAKYLVFRFWHQNNSTETYQQALDSIQIERGSQAASYASYFTPIELCKIGTYQDYIYKSDGKWYVRKEIREKVLTRDNMENLSVSRRASGYQFDFGNSGAHTGDLTGYWFYCDRFARNYFNNRDNIVNSIYGYADSRVRILTDVATNTSGFKDWVEANSPTIYYVLATPTDTEITNQALIAQLEAVNRWITRYGYNASVTGNLPIIIDKTQL